MKNANVFALLLIFLSMSACQTYSPQRYIPATDTAVVLKTYPKVRARVEPFVLSSAFDAACRGAGDFTPPVNMTVQGYIQQAFSDELKLADLYDEMSPDVVLSGVIDALSFSSAKGLTGGEWNIGIKLSSSNGASMYATENYLFESAFGGDTACKRAAEAFLPATQKLILQVVRSESFRSLLRRK